MMDNHSEKNKPVYQPYQHHQGFQPYYTNNTNTNTNNTNINTINTNTITNYPINTTPNSDQYHFINHPHPQPYHHAARSPPFPQHTPPSPYPNQNHQLMMPFSPFESPYHHHPNLIPHPAQIHSPRSDYLPHPHPIPQTPIQDTFNSHSSPLRRPAHPKSHLHSPFVSPKPHWQNHQSRLLRSPASQANSQRQRSIFPKSPYSSASSPSTQGPKSPSSIPITQQPLVRGSLAQAKLRGHHVTTKPDHIPIGNLLIDQPDHIISPYLQRPSLPKPPNHSQHALWVGNIPSDASHEELWKFFAGRAPPNNKNQFKSPQAHIDQRLPSSGVESIHLIARSNCAFVNYISQQHLEHAIASCNSKPLRPMDPYCKPLLCRVRKPEDNIKSGVGAQRIGGMHRSWVKRFDHPAKSPNTHPIPDRQKATRDAADAPNNRTSSTLTSTSNQSQSTTSSFLAHHFPRRYFILKSYTDEDLRISVERSIWVSQTHNEPILDQAYRTSPEGVYLIFSTNQSGEFFGYAKMAGPIWKPGRRYSAPTSPTPDPGKVLRARSVSIGGLGCPRRNLGDICDRVGFDGLFGGDDSLTISSPRALTPVEGERPEKIIDNRSQFSPSRRSLPILSNLFNRSPIPTYSSKPSLANQFEDDHQPNPQPIMIGESRAFARSRSSSHTTTGSHHSFESQSSTQPDLMTGRPFKVDWLRVQSLTFYRTKNLRNPFNGNREVKVSRDGTEVEPSIGQAIIDEIDKEYFRLNPS